MKLLQQILLLLLAWFANTVNAKSVFIKTNVPNYEFSFLKTENQRLESEVKIGVSNFARSSLSENLFSQRAILWESSVLENRAREGNIGLCRGRGR